MKVFDGYAKYYDLLYRDKDYQAEADCVHKLIDKHAPSSKSILELGCGTGRHGLLLVRKGYVLHGVDLNDKMIAIAQKNRASLAGDLYKDISFAKGDIRTMKMKKRFDVVISLFHVISYQNTNEDLRAAFETATAHLNPGGVFIFDCWYGPAVLSERPSVRIKRLEDETIKITRIAEPKLYVNDNCVDVNYHILIHEKSTRSLEVIKECHRMRYLFEPEIRELFRSMRMKMIFSHGWMTFNEPSLDTWSACFGGRKQ